MLIDNRRINTQTRPYIIPERDGDTTADKVEEILRDRGYTVRYSRDYLNANLDNPYMVFAKR
jgi:hypothetical protein